MRPLLPLIAIALLALLGCSPDSPQDGSDTGPSSGTETVTIVKNPDREAYFGDLHVHTMYSFDAFIFGTTASPDDAYEFAKGGPIRHPGGFDMQLKRPLDFYSVTDHAFYMGALRAMANPGTRLSRHEVAADMDRLGSEADRRDKFVEILTLMQSDRYAELLDDEVFRDAWEDIVATANRHYEPGSFTTFIGYEYTASGADRANLHRNVIFNGSRMPPLPFSRLDSSNPEELWQWMDGLRQQGFELLSIPHNSNGSNGEMFRLTTFDGKPLTADYAGLRMRNEPLVEISQVKGTSETHPALSPNDDWADFEIMGLRIATDLPSQPEGSYVREALLNGLLLQERKGFNPFQFGMVAASDTHNASYAGDEDNYWSKVGLLDDTGQERGSVPLDQPDEDGNEYTDGYYDLWGAAGLTGVWAEANTREDIFAAFQRKETFGTSGPRIRVRFFAGEDLPEHEDQAALRKSYQSGVPMGGELQVNSARSPDFLVWAARDPRSAPLQRLQVIKGYVRNGEVQEEVFDVACSDGGQVDPVTHRCPDNGARVNLEDCSISAGLGAAELKANWQDPDFRQHERAVYYVRVLENPTCRWSTWDAIRSGVAPRKDLHATIQERAWSSPIWITAKR